MKTCLTFCILILTLNFSFAQFTINGSVANEQGEDLIGASVFLVGSEFASISDHDGNFELTGVPAGMYNLKLSYLGYKSMEQRVEIKQNVDLGIIELKGSFLGLDEVEIRATWSDEEAPFAQETITRETIEKTNLGQDVPFMLKWTPSSVVTSDAGAGVGYTGIRIRGTDPSRINVTINGVPLNDSESQGVFWVDLPDFLASVDEIQIQRGVGTSTNGAGAFGASINMNTNQTNINPYSKLTLGAGSFNTKKFSVESGTGLMRDKYSFNFRLSNIKSDGYIDRASSDLRSLYFKAGRITDKSALNIHVFTGSEVTYQAWNGLPYQFLETDRTYNPSGTEREGEPHPNEVDDYDQAHLQVLYNRLLKSWKLNMGFHYTKGRGFFEQYKADQNLADYNLPESESDLIRRRWLDNDFIGVIYAAEREFGKTKLILGGAVNNYVGDHFGQVIWTENETEIPRDHTYYINQGRKLDANGYAKVNYAISDRFKFFGDLQYRRLNYEFFGFNEENESVQQEVGLNFINPKLGLSYHMDDNSRFFASFAVGNKEPNRSDYTESTFADRPVHETLYDLEFGYALERDKWGVNANAYNMIYDNQLVLTGRINDVGEYIRQNVKSSYRTGLELSAYAQVHKFVTIQPSVTLSKNGINDYVAYLDDWDTGEQLALEFGDTTQLAFSPSVIASNAIHFNVGDLFSNKYLKSTQLSFMSKYVGDQYIDNTSRAASLLESYLYHDLRLHWDIKINKIDKLTLNVQVNNVFNTLYSANAWIYRFKSVFYDPTPDDPYARSEGGGIYNLTGLFPQAGRNFLVGLSVKF